MPCFGLQTFSVSWACVLCYRLSCREGPRPGLLRRKKTFLCTLLVLNFVALDFAILGGQYFAGFYFRDFNRQIWKKDIKFRDSNMSQLHFIFQKGLNFLKFLDKLKQAIDTRKIDTCKTQSFISYRWIKTEMQNAFILAWTQTVLREIVWSKKSRFGNGWTQKSNHVNYFRTYCDGVKHQSIAKLEFPLFTFSKVESVLSTWV